MTTPQIYFSDALFLSAFKEEVVWAGKETAVSLKREQAQTATLL